MMLLDRPRSATLFAAIVLILSIATFRDIRFASFFVDERSAFPLGVGTSVFARSGSIAALVQLVLAAVCLPLGLDRSRIPRDVRVGLLLFLAIAIAAGALAVAIDTGLSGAHPSNAAGAVMALALTLLAVAIGAQAERLDPILLGRPGPWGIVVLALVIATFDLVATHMGAARWAYVLVVLGGLLFAERAFVRVFTVIALGLTLFGSAAAPRGEIATFAGIADAGLAIGAILLAAFFVDRTLRTRQAQQHIADQTAAIEHLTGTAHFELDLTSMTFTPTPAFGALHDVSAQPRQDWGSFLAAHIPPQQQVELAASMAAARHGQTAETVAYSFHRRDGETGDALLRWVPIRDDRGVTARLTGIVHDVTRHYRCERGSAELRAQLCQAQKLETLGLLAGGVAHDLSNTLVPVTILAPLVMEAITDPTDRQSMALIIESAQRARELARDMLAYTREEAVTLERVRLDDLIRGYLPLLRARVPAEISIVEALAPVPAITGNIRQLYQVVLNLTVNAAQAIGSRGGTITIGTIAEPARDGGRRSVRLFVSDDGEGIDPATLDRIFEPFFSTKQGDDANGIGLAIVRRIVQTHGGVISAKGAPGQGARFDLLFPAATAARRRKFSSPASETQWQSAST
ncbi:two-component system sensor histidine kinase NtrB [Sphingomonas glacialis]|nr:ATP-binding protein [Sphingomonas glacialis]